MMGIQLEHKWDILNNLDGFFIRIPVGNQDIFMYATCEYKWDTLNIQKNSKMWVIDWVIVMFHSMI